MKEKKISKIKNIITKNLSKKKILLLFILTNIVYAIMLTITIPKVLVYANGMKILDMIPEGYNKDYINFLFSTLGTEGRDAYLFKQIPLDLIYPSLFGITYCLLYVFIITKLNKQDTPLFYLCLIPIFAGMFDYLENFGIIILLNSYPNISITISKLTSFFSVAKSALTLIYFAIISITLIALLIKFIISKNKKSNR
ncbi:hypothetical protein [Chryseobacterium sp. YIM B08800]|uniref:hypothetical protein n=1 Tax=Chryseobacterium sp. YIM B08800 TaxID=2984136 RepID=UPI0022409821|nr:hypothetical protein [Chryseobacterium sp. YIM B08800]